MGDAVASIDGELREHALFTALTDNQLARAEQHASFIQLDAGEHLFEQGQRADRFFLVRSGQLKLYRLSATGSSSGSCRNPRRPACRCWGT